MIELLGLIIRGTAVFGAVVLLLIILKIIG